MDKPPGQLQGVPPAEIPGERCSCGFAMPSCGLEMRHDAGRLNVRGGRGFAILQPAGACGSSTLRHHMLFNSRQPQAEEAAMAVQFQLPWARSPSSTATSCSAHCAGRDDEVLHRLCIPQAMRASCWSRRPRLPRLVPEPPRSGSQQRQELRDCFITTISTTVAFAYDLANTG